MSNWATINLRELRPTTLAALWADITGEVSSEMVRGMLEALVGEEEALEMVNAELDSMP
jgi:hypothetical protein